MKYIFQTTEKIDKCKAHSFSEATGACDCGLHMSVFDMILSEILKPEEPCSKT